MQERFAFQFFWKKKDESKLEIGKKFGEKEMDELKNSNDLQLDAVSGNDLRNIM